MAEPYSERIRKDALCLRHQGKSTTVIARRLAAKTGRRPSSATLKRWFAAAGAPPRQSLKCTIIEHLQQGTSVASITRKLRCDERYVRRVKRTLNNGSSPHHHG